MREDHEKIITSNRDITRAAWILPITRVDSLDKMLWTAVKLAILAVLVYKVAFVMRIMGFHKTVYKHHPGPCRVIESLARGSEDMERIPGDKVLITAEMRFTHGRFNEHYAGRSGKVYMFDFNYPETDPEQVTISNYPGDLSESDFHGMSVWVNKQTGVVSVFIVNHAVTYSTVEIFTYNDAENTLYHRKTCKDDMFRLMNDVVAVSDSEFYITNILHYRYGLGKLEGYTQMRWGSVVFYDGERANIAISGLLTPNGINKSPDGRYIYVAHFADREILVYERHTNNTLTSIQIWPTYTLPDNIIVDPDSGDWLGCHPALWKSNIHMENPSSLSPSQVLHLRTRGGVIEDMTEPFSDDGSLISGSSVAIQHNNKLLIGSVASQTAICDVHYVE